MGSDGEAGIGLDARRRLPPPAGGGAAAPVLEALKRRATLRQFSDAPLSEQTLSNLLWAAFGVNRSLGPFGARGRTAASASNSQEIEVYVALEGGAYRYDAPQHALERVAEGDLRRLALTPGQAAMAAVAPAQLIFVADFRRLAHTQGFDEPGLHDPEIQKAYAHVDTGLIAGNVHLYAAAEGLAAWFHNCDRAGLHRALGLAEAQAALFAQSVGWPPEP